MGAFAAMMLARERPGEIDTVPLPRHEALHPSPADWRDEVLYRLPLDRPDDAPPADESAIRRASSRLYDLKRLGATTLWLGHAFRREADTAHAADDAFPAFELDPTRGAPRDLVDLVAEAHWRGLRVILEIPVDQARLPAPELFARTVRRCRYWIALTDCDGLCLDTLAPASRPSPENFRDAIGEFAANLGKDNFLLLDAETDGNDDVAPRTAAAAALRLFAPGLPRLAGGLAPANLRRVAALARARALLPVLRRGRCYRRPIAVFGDRPGPAGPGELIPWSLILDDEEALCVVNGHGLEPRGGRVLVDTHLTPPGSEMTVLVNTAEAAAGDGYRGRHAAGTRLTVRGAPQAGWTASLVDIRDLGPSEALILSNHVSLAKLAALLAGG